MTQDGRLGIVAARRDEAAAHAGTRQERREAALVDTDAGDGRPRRTLLAGRAREVEDGQNRHEDGEDEQRPPAAPRT